MKWETIPEIDLYSDGGAEPNPGKGGFGVIMSYKGIKKEFSQGFRLTTNNRMELMGVIYGLQRLKTKSIVNVYTDSRYVVDGIIHGWAKKWKSNNWYRTKAEKALNYDLWDHLLILIAKHEKVNFNWIRGHIGHPENERCDSIANTALRGNNLEVDIIYEENLYTNTGFELDVLQSSVIDQENLKIGTINKKKSGSKVREEGDPCRKCGNPVILKHSKEKKLKPNQTYYFEYYFQCLNCKINYYVDEAKRFI